MGIVDAEKKHAPWCITAKPHVICSEGPIGLPREAILAEVRLQEGEPLENALRRFKRKVQAEDIIKEVKRHSYYLKPGEKRRVKQALARKRAKKKSRRDRDSRSDRD
jgi:small subunit ribosomal protein S21